MSAWSRKAQPRRAQGIPPPLQTAIPRRDCGHHVWPGTAQHRPPAYRDFKRYFIASPCGAQPCKHLWASQCRPPAMSPPLVGSSSLPQRRAARCGVARRSVDSQGKMGYGSVSGVAPRQGLGTARMGRLRGGAPPFRVLIGNGEAQHPGVEVPQLQKIVANDAHMSQVGDQSPSFSSW
jgi:hypothetical protein